MRLVTVQGCSVEGCGNAAASRGLCNRHALRFYRYGDPLASGPNKNRLINWLRKVSSYRGDKCLEWPFSKDQNGYGQFKYKGARHAHRAMCIMVYGLPPSPKHEAAHSCRNRACVSPNHLSWKTASENRLGRIVDFTYLRGERNHRAKLTADQVRIIKKLRGRVTGRALAERFGVTPALISRIYRGQCWGWLE